MEPRLKYELIFWCKIKCAKNRLIFQSLIIILLTGSWGFLLTSQLCHYCQVFLYSKILDSNLCSIFFTFKHIPRHFKTFVRNRIRKIGKMHKQASCKISREGNQQWSIRRSADYHCRWESLLAHLEHPPSRSRAPLGHR